MWESEADAHQPCPSAPDTAMDDFLATIAQGFAPTLVGENCAPANNAIDPNETVSVNFSLRNVSAGNASTTNLVATLLQTGGITVPGGAQTYGALSPGGAAVSRTFTFTTSLYR